MTSQEKNKINELANRGLSALKIAATLNLPVNTIKSYLRRQNDMQSGRCLECGAKFKIVPGLKPRRFCSDTCRMKWWNAHRLEGNKKAYYSNFFVVIVICKTT